MSRSKKSKYRRHAAKWFRKSKYRLGIRQKARQMIREGKLEAEFPLFVKNADYEWF
jgi:hypothetical protein